MWATRQKRLHHSLISRWPYLISIPEPDSVNTTIRPLDQRQQHQYWVVEGYTHSSTLAYSAAVSQEDDDR